MSGGVRALGIAAVVAVALLLSVGVVAADMSSGIAHVRDVIVDFWSNLWSGAPDGSLESAPDGSRTMGLRSIEDSGSGSTNVPSGVFGWLNDSIPSTATIDTYKNASIVTVESTLNWDTVTSGTWNTYKASVQYCSDESLRSGLRMSCGGDYGSSSYIATVTDNITSYLPDLTAAPYLATMQFIVVNFTNTTSPDKAAFVNSVAEHISEQTGNKFKIMVVEGVSGLDSVWVAESEVQYKQLTTKANWIDWEATTLRGNATKSRIYSSNESLLDNVSDYQYNILTKMRDSHNTSDQYSETDSVKVLGGDLILYNNGTAAPNTVTSPAAGYYWDIHNDTLCDNTVSFYVDDFTYIIREDSFEKIVMASGNSSALWASPAYAEALTYLGNGDPNNNWVWQTSNCDVKVEMWDPTFVKSNAFMLHYEWVSTSPISDYSPYAYIIIGDNDSTRLSNNVGRPSNTYGYLAMGDYANTDAWLNGKKASVDHWTDTCNVNLFLDEVDMGAAGANFSNRFKALVDYIRIDKGKRAITNVYTEYATYSTYGDATLKESCFARWDGDIYAPTYSYGDISLDTARASFYAEHNVSILGVSFGALDDYDKLSYCAAAFAVVYGFDGNNYFRHSQPLFLTQYDINLYDYGAMLEGEFTETSSSDWNRLYAAGRVHIDPVNHTWYIEDEKVASNMSVSVSMYSGGVGSGDRNVYVYVNGNTRHGTIPYNAGVDPLFTWVERTAYLNATADHVDHGHYWMYGYTRPTSGGWNYLGRHDASTFHPGLHTWFDTSSENLPDTVTGQTWTFLPRDNNWMFNLSVNYTTTREVDELTDRLTQSTDITQSGSTNEYITTITSEHDTALPVWSFEVACGVGGNSFVKNATDTYVALNSGGVGWNYTTVDGEQYGVQATAGGYQYRTPYASTHVFKTTAYIDPPPTPVNLANTTGNFWVNHTWQAGSGNTTDSYNVNVNDTWHNGTTNTFWNNTPMPPHGWSNVTVHAFNATDGGSISVLSVSQNMQIPNNLITITNTSDWSGNIDGLVYVDYDATDLDSDTPTFSCNRTDLFTDFSTASGKGNWTAIFGTRYVDFGVTDGWGSTSNYTMTISTTAIPPTPCNLTNTTGNFWVNHTWQAGSGVVTDSYNVSVNSAWTNGTAVTSNNTTYSTHAWQNITIYAWNSTTSLLSAGSASQDTQIPNNPITITNTGDWGGGVGDDVYVDYNATDADLDTPTFSCNRTDLFTDFSTATGKGNWTAVVGVIYVDFGVSDGYGSTDNYTMTLAVDSAPPDPTNLANTTSNFWVKHTWDIDPTWNLIVGGTSGTFTGYTWTGSAWQSNSGLVSGLPSWSFLAPAPTVFHKDGIMYLIFGELNGVFHGYKWTGSTWQSDSAITGGLGDLGGSSAPTTFWDNNTLYLISGAWSGVFNGFNWTGSTWQCDSAIAGGLGDIGYESSPAAFLLNESWYLISGINVGAFSGFNWDGSTWQPDSIPGGIAVGLQNGNHLAPTIFMMDGVQYLITGDYCGTFYGYNLTSTVWGTVWQEDTAIVSGLPSIGYSHPTAFTKDTCSVRVNGVWYNDTANTLYNGSYTPHAWQNITVYACNPTFTNPLSFGSVSQNTQVPNNPPTITNTGDWSLCPGGIVSVDYNATDADSDTPTFSCNRTDLFTDFDTATGTGHWTAELGTIYVDFGVSDGWGGIDNYTLEVACGNLSTPPTPINLQNTTGNFWVNHTWQVGAGTITDSYNVRVNDVWHNGTTNTYWDNINLSSHGWSNISVYAWNSSGTGTSSVNNASQDTQIPNNPPSVSTVLPVANETDVRINPTLYAPVLDVDTDTMSVAFYEYAGSQIGSTQTGIANGGMASVVWSGRDTNTTYYWYVVVNDTYSETTSAAVPFTTHVSHWVAISDCNNRQIAEGGEIYNDFNYTTDDPGDVMVFTTNATRGTLDSATGVYNWTTTLADIGEYTWWFNVSNAYNQSDLCTCRFSVTRNVVSPPIMLTQTHNRTWVNWTWDQRRDGSYYGVSSWNVSINDTWHNTTYTQYYNHTGLDYLRTSSIVVWGYNNVSHQLSNESVSDTCVISPKYGNYTVIEPEWAGKVTFNRTHEGGKTIDLLGVHGDRLAIRYNNGGDIPALSAVTVISGSLASSVCATDLDGDGDIDIIENGGRWFANDGSEHFTLRQFRTSGYICGNVDIHDGGLAADVDNDGDMDVISWCEVARVEVHFNRGDGTFDTVLLPSIGGLYSIRTGDFDNDGDLDLIAQGTVLEQVSPIHWVPHSITSTGSIRPTFAADYNGDGNLDILAATLPGYIDGDWQTGTYRCGRLQWHAGDGAFGFTPVEPPLTLLSTRRVDDLPYITQIWAADFDWDGNLDVLTGNLDYEDCWVFWEWTGLNKYAEWYFGPYSNWFGKGKIHVVDLNSDGNLDPLAPNGYCLGDGNGGSYAFCGSGFSGVMSGSMGAYGIDVDGDYIILRRNYVNCEQSGDITTQLYTAAKEWTGVEIGGYNSIGTSAHAYWYYSPDNVVFNVVDLGAVSFGSYISLPTAATEKYGYLKIVLSTTNDQFSPAVAYMVLYEAEAYTSYNLVTLKDVHGNLVLGGELAAYDKTAGQYACKWQTNTEGYHILQDIGSTTEHDFLLMLKTFDGVFTLNTVSPAGSDQVMTTNWTIPINYNVNIHPEDQTGTPLADVFCGLSEYAPLNPLAFWGVSMGGRTTVPVGGCSGFAMCDLFAEKPGYTDYNVTALNWTSRSAMIKDYRHDATLEEVG